MNASQEPEEYEGRKGDDDLHDFVASIIDQGDENAQHKEQAVYGELPCHGPKKGGEIIGLCPYSCTYFTQIPQTRIPIGPIDHVEISGRRDVKIIDTIDHQIYDRHSKGNWENSQDDALKEGFPRYMIGLGKPEAGLERVQAINQ